MKMKITILASIYSLISLAAMAQTPPTNPGSDQTASIPTGAEGKVAYINASQFRQGIDDLRIKLDALGLEFEPKRKEIQSLDEEIKNLKSKIQTQSNTVSPQVRAQWLEDSSEKEKILKRKTEDYEALLQKRLAQVSQPIYEKIQNFFQEYCQQRQIVLVLESGAASQTNILIWATATADITADFIKEYNKANPAVAQKK